MDDERNNLLLKELVECLTRNKAGILNGWITDHLKGTALRTDLISKEELEAQSSEFIDSFIEAISGGNLEDITNKEYAPIVNMLAEISKNRAVQGFTLTETATYIFSVKGIMFDFLQKEFESKPNILTNTLLVLSNLIDKLGMVTFESFLNSREKVIREHVDVLAKIATPVLLLWKDILFLPIVGIVNPERAQVIMEQMLQKVSDYNSKIIILDILGVPVVDSAVANHILKITRATKLMGCETVITGISAAIAQTMVQLGIDMGGLMTKATLIDGLAYAFDFMGFQITAKPGTAAKRKAEK